MLLLLGGVGGRGGLADGRAAGVARGGVRGRLRELGLGLFVAALGAVEAEHL